jgi:hypothetical protein
MRLLPVMGLVVGVSALVAACGSDSSSGGPREGGAGNGATPTCAAVCPGILAKQCPGGPANESDCESGCQTVRSKCESQFDALYRCAGSKPTYTCGGATSVIVNGCESLSSALSTCVTS